MKTERLLKIIFYLLSHPNVSSKALAQHFAVSTRTIKRDMEDLILAGIPIVTKAGRGGGYAISDDFQLARPLSNSSDYTSLLTALKSLNSALDGDNLSETLGKLLAVQKSDSSAVVVDFGVAKENSALTDLLTLLKSAISEQKLVKFHYHGHENWSKVQPIAPNFRWYAWYLLAFDCEKNDFRIFKLLRMAHVEKTYENFTPKIASAQLDQFIENQWAKDSRKSLTIKLFCQAEILPDITEYFRPKILEKQSNGDFTCEFSVIESERLWFSLLLGFGEQVKVLAPPEVADNLVKTAQKIIQVYKK